MIIYLLLHDNNLAYLNEFEILKHQKNLTLNFVLFFIFCFASYLVHILSVSFVLVCNLNINFPIGQLLN